MDAIDVYLGSVLKTAIVYCNRHGHHLTADEYNAAKRDYRDTLKAHLLAALDDAGAAMDANMGRVAEETYLASARLDGIAIARTVLEMDVLQYVD